MPLKAVFLDLGNTLLVERRSRAELYCEEARGFGLEVSPARMRDCMARARDGLPLSIGKAFRYSDAWFQAFQRRIFVEELGLDPSHFEDLSERLFARFEDPDSFVLYPDARSVLAELRERGLVLGLISNWSSRLTRLLDALGLREAFDFVLGSADVGLEKPDPALFHRALARARAAAEACLHAGDDLACDVHGAQGAGIPAVLVDHARRLGPQEPVPCPVVRSLVELRDLILERLP